MKKSSRVLLSIGQVRNESVFFDQLLEINDLLQSGEISRSVLCTQEGNISPAQVEESLRLGTEIFTITALQQNDLRSLDPSIDDRNSGLRKYSGGLSSGTPWIQLRTFRLGMNALDKNSIVLKLRPDVLITAKLINGFFDLIEDSYQDEGEREPFIGKFLVQWLSVSQPLYIDDMVFGGYWDDLDKMVSRDFNSHLARRYPPASLPSMFWIELFAAYNPKLQETALRYLPVPFSPRLLLRRDFRTLLLSYLNFAQKHIVVAPGKIARFMQWDLETPNYKIWKNLDRKQFPLGSILRNPRQQNAVDHSADLDEAILSLSESFENFNTSMSIRTMAFEVRHQIVSKIQLALYLLIKKVRK